MEDRILRELVQMQEAGERGVLALVVRTEGSAPQVCGARLILKEDGTLIGTIGGGRFEHVVLDECRRLLEGGGAPRLVEFDLGPDLGMSCGGAMSAYLELLVPRPRLVIFGAGHVGQEVARIASKLEFERWVVDDRPEFASEERFPGCRRVVQPFAEVARTFSVRGGDYLLIVTHGHLHDQLLLEALLHGPWAYLGMIGSKTKVRGVLEGLAKRGEPAELLARVHSPVGLPIGSVTPTEIAISILAEMIACRRQKPA